MNRTKLIQEILGKVKTQYPQVLESSLKRLSDPNLIAFAMEMDINTDEYFKVTL